VNPRQLRHLSSKSGAVVGLAQLSVRRIMTSR
jgi:hypothetical protein